MTGAPPRARADSALDRSIPHLVRSFTRHFKRHTSTTPARYASSHARQ
jgi:transcriptional regulator GlxA family with amidase domain